MLRQLLSSNLHHSPSFTRTLIPQNRETHLNNPPLSASSATILSLLLSALHHHQAKFMAASMDIIIPRSLSVIENGCFERPSTAFRNCNALSEWNDKQKLVVHIAVFATKYACSQIKSPQPSRRGWRTAFALDTSGLPDNNDQDSFNNFGTELGGTRLGRIVSAAGRQLLEKLNSARKNFPMKVFLLLLGFYTANALATILGQTGDWDVLVAGVIVAAIEGIGMLMYRKPSSMSRGRMQSLVVMINYWKAGICLGLFVDAFKLGS